MTELDGKTVVITGAASGIGKACAEGFLADGARVLGVDINPDGLKDIEALGAVTMAVDVSDDAMVRGMIQKAMEETGRIDVLMNNAGYGLGTRVEDYEDGEFERMMAVHVFGAVYSMRAAIPHMRKQQHGRIINMISRGAQAQAPRVSAYASAKAALWALTRCTAMEVADSNILVNAMIPGMTNTSIWGQPRPELQPPSATYPTARMLATLPPSGVTAKVFWDEMEYPLFLSTIPEGATLEPWAGR
jgi:NAD(P)-dependent dehydrogenase (short-subunit alcohol dehydrogenase family)